MSPELAVFDRWAADPNDLAKWEAAMAALAPAAGADELSAARFELAFAGHGQAPRHKRNPLPPRGPT